MKKSLFMLGAAIVALSSCTQDEVLNVNENRVISFESHVNKSTRAVTNTTTADLEKFYVFGNHGTTNVFNNVAVTKNGSAWEYTNPVAWTANNYKFAAYATTNSSAQLATGVAYSDGVLTFSDYVPNDASDLVAAVASVDNTGLANATVNFNFQHLLSKVQFVLANNSTENYTMKVGDITFSVLKQGDCVYNGTATWTPEGSATTLTVAGTTTNIAKGASFTSEDYIVIPNQALASVAASFKVEFYDASDNKVYEKQYSDVALKLIADDSQKWTPGYLYQYNGTIAPTTSYITFSVTQVDAWTTATPGVAL